MRQTIVGLNLAFLIVSGWAAIHLYGILFYRLTASSAWACVPLVWVETWLSAGMFIVAHDAIHGSLSPAAPVLNRPVGRLLLGLYAFFPYDALATKHHAHHRYSGHENDPDFNPQNPHDFWPWYWRFFTQYFKPVQILAIASVIVFYAAVLRAPLANVLLFWALPAILSSVQLFTFGTWLPHRRQTVPFADHHNARTLDYGRLASLLACFHFGYHIEHHRAPHMPWWTLPRVRAARLAIESQG